MKTLQNNFTTPEQSKRLLELGVPADSADMYYKHTMLTPYVFANGVLFSVYSVAEDITPCWSVGRLIEIYETCTSCLFERRYTELSVLEYVLAQIAESIMATDECWDFSKLEE